MLLILLVIMGCNTKKNSKPVTREEIFTGTDALVFNFLKNAPPPEVYASTETEKSQFSVVVELKNKGAYYIKEDEGYLTLILEEDYMSLGRWGYGEEIRQSDNNQTIFSLEGKSLSNPLGGRAVTAIRVNARKLPEKLSETHKSSILLTACYKYQTEVYENVCIDTDVYGLRGMDKSCKVEDLSLKSQGAPIAITKVEVEMLPHENQTKIKPLFTIHVENKGNGEVIKANQDVIRSACSSESLKIKEKDLNVAYINDLNVVYIKAYLSGEEYELDCAPEFIKLRQKQGFVRCRLKEGKEKKYGTYESPLIIKLDYGYMQTIAKEVTIKRPITY